MKSKIIFLLMTLALFSMFVSCKSGAEASVNYEDPDSLLIPKLISLEVFDNEWSIEKIYDAQNFYPQNSPNSPVEFATRTIWASSNLLIDDVLIEHHLYRYAFPLKDIEDFVYTVNGKYSYIETDINGIALYQYCDENIKTENISCAFAFIPEESQIVSALGVVFPNKNIEGDISSYARLIFNKIIKAVKSNLLSLN